MNTPEKPEDKPVVPEIPPSEPAPAESVAEEKATEQKPEPVKAGPGFWTLALRWTLGFLIVFGFGVLLVTFVFYIPLRQQTFEHSTELMSATKQISSLQDQINNLQSLDTKNKELQKELDQANLHIALLEARSDIATAQLAMANNDPASAQVTLTKTPQTLDRIANLLPPDQRDVIHSMQERLKLAMGELKENSYAAQSDLDVLSTGLVKLENSLFTPQ